MSFGIGISDAITVVETCFKIWRGIGAVRDFPEDIVEQYTMLTMEYTRFVSWTEIHGIWTQSSKLSLRQTEISDTSEAVTTPEQQLPGQPSAEDGSNVEVRFLNNEERNWTAIASILRVLERVEALTAKYRTESTMPATESLSISAGLMKNMESLGLRSGTNLRKMQVRRAAQVTSLMRLSFVKKASSSVAPWKTADKEALEKYVASLQYWNEKLYEDQVPLNIRESIASQGVPGAMLDETISVDPTYVQVLQQASQDRDQPMVDCTKLWIERRRTEGLTQYGQLEGQLEKLRIQDGSVKFDDEHLPLWNFGMGTLSRNNQAPCRVAAEWYPFGQASVEEKSRARNRVVNLAQTCQLKDKPSGIRILDCVGYVEDNDVRQSFGLLFEIPTWAHPSRGARTLQSLLPPAGKDVVYLSLGQRIQLAAQLATAIHSFGIVRWFHKNFNSHKIFFFSDKVSGKYNFKWPWIVGFDISRPDNTQTEIASMNKDLEEMSIYLHPDLRIAGPSERPKYMRRYDIYSLGLVLVEIGFWSKLGSLMKSKLGSSPEQFREAIILKCEAQLAHFMGIRYKDLVVNCLKGDDITESVDDFYWIVVIELLKCPLNCQEGFEA